MGTGQIGLLLLIFFDLLPSLSPSPLQKSSASEYVQERVGVEGTNEELSTIEGNTLVVSVNRFGGGGRGGGSFGSGRGSGGGVSAGGSRSSGKGGTGGSGTSKSPYKGAGSGAIPVFIPYHGNNHNHSGAGCSIGSYDGLTALGTAILTSLFF